MNKLCNQVCDLKDDTPWETFMTSFRLACLHTPDLTDLGKKIVVFNKIKGTMAHFKNSCLNPYSEDPNDPLRKMSFAEYLREVQLKVSPKPDRTQAEQIYENRVQGPSEKLDIYLFDKYQLFLKLHEAMEVGHEPDYVKYYTSAIAGLFCKELRYRIVGYVPPVKSDVRAFDKHVIEQASNTLQLLKNGDLTASNARGVEVRSIKPPFMADLIDRPDHNKSKPEAHFMSTQPGICYTAPNAAQVIGGEQHFTGNGRVEKGNRTGRCFWCDSKGHWAKECWKRRAGHPKKSANQVNSINELLDKCEAGYYFDPESAEICELNNPDNFEDCEDLEPEIAELQRRGYSVQRNNNFRSNSNNNRFRQPARNYNNNSRSGYNFSSRGRTNFSRNNNNNNNNTNRNFYSNNRRQIHYVDEDPQQQEESIVADNTDSLQVSENEATSVNHLGIHQLAYTALDDPHSENEDADYEDFAKFEFGRSTHPPRYNNHYEMRGNTAIIGQGSSYTHNSAIRRQETAELCSIMEALKTNEGL